MKRKQRPSTHIFTLGVIGFILIIIAFVLLRQNTQQPPITSQPIVSLMPMMREYHSEQFKYNFKYPGKFELDDKVLDVVLKNNDGEILIHQIGTNYKTIDGFLTSISTYNHFEVTNKENLVINNYPAVKYIAKFGISKDPDDQTYYIYPAPWTIFSFSTSSPALYADLDQVAKSFRYEQ